MLDCNPFDSLYLLRIESTACICSRNHTNAPAPAIKPPITIFRSNNTSDGISPAPLLRTLRHAVLRADVAPVCLAWFSIGLSGIPAHDFELVDLEIVIGGCGADGQGGYCERDGDEGDKGLGLHLAG